MKTSKTGNTGYTMQRGGIGVGLVIALAFLVLIAGVIGVCAMSYFSAYNYGNRMENDLQAIQDGNRNRLAEYGQKVMEVAQVPQMYAKDLNKMTEDAIKARYGADGSKGMMQWIKEQNPTLDPSMYKQIQQVIEAGRNDFQNGQEHQIDVVRQYKTQLGTLWTGFWLKIAGYPKEDLSKFDIVSTDRADTAFKNHKEDGPIQLRQP